jgi:ACDE family multidrug resistance protein
MVVIACVIIAGAFIGVNNTLVTTAVMSIAPVERPVASATYGFVRFIGGGLAPYVAGLLVAAFNPRIPFLLATATLIAAAIVLSTVHKALTAADRGEIAQPVVTELDKAENENPFPEATAIGNAD